MIITDDNFASIVAAVEEGRGIYENIRKTLQYLLAGNTGELLLMTLCVIVGLPTPLLPIHLLWINLVTDGLPALCLATDPIDSDVMKRHPRHRSERLTNRSFLRTMGLTGFLTAGVAFAVYLWSLKTGTTETAALPPSPCWSLLNSCGRSARAVQPNRSGASPFSRTSTSSLWLPFLLACRCGVSTARLWADSSRRPTCHSSIALAGLPGNHPLLVLEGVKLLRTQDDARRLRRTRNAAPATRHPSASSV